MCLLTKVTKKISVSRFLFARFFYTKPEIMVEVSLRIMSKINWKVSYEELVNSI